MVTKKINCARLQRSYSTIEGCKIEKGKESG